MRRQPAFWQDKRGGEWRAMLLSPLSQLYSAATARRVSRQPLYRPNVPVICVGNISVGGTGKTPTVIGVLERLAARGSSAHVVTRGYGGRERGPTVVDPGSSAQAVGDEALLLAAFAPVVVAKSRAAGARTAVAAGAEVVVMDDGFQNPEVAKDLSIVVVDAEVGFGNGRVLPAGPLREPVERGLQRADLLLAVGDDSARSALARPKGVTYLEAVLEPLSTGMDWQGLRVVAFAGIGRPEKFFSTLRSQGADIVEAIPLADHQPFGTALLGRLSRLARQTGAQLVTTEKDAVRLPPAFRRDVLTLPVRLRWIDPSPLDDELDRLLGRR